MEWSARRTIKIAILVIGIAFSASSIATDDQDLIMAMEVEIAIRNAAKSALAKSREQAWEAIKQTSIYTKFKETESDVLRLGEEYLRLSKEYTKNPLNDEVVLARDLYDEAFDKYLAINDEMNK